MKVSRPGLVLTVSALAWLLLVISLYYAGHKPFSPVMLLRIAISAGQIFTGLLVVSLAGGIGRRLIHPSGISPIALLALQAAAGLGLLSIGMLLVSATIGVNSLICWIIVVSLALLFWRDTWLWFSGWKSLAQIWDASGRFGKALGSGICIVLLYSLIIALAPPIKFDALVYHLALPKLYLSNGGFKYIPEIMFWGMPQAGEMLYTLGMGLAGHSAAVLVGWWAGVIALFGVLGFTVDRFGINPGWVAATSLISGYTLTQLLSAGYVEWFAILFGAGLLILLDHWWAEGKGVQLALGWHPVRVCNGEQIHRGDFNHRRRDRCTGSMPGTQSGDSPAGQEPCNLRYTRIIGICPLADQEYSGNWESFLPALLPCGNHGPISPRCLPIAPLG